VASAKKAIGAIIAVIYGCLKGMQLAKNIDSIAQKAAAIGRIIPDDKCVIF
jgi:hypothetical protein